MPRLGRRRRELLFSLKKGLNTADGRKHRAIIKILVSDVQVMHMESRDNPQVDILWGRLARIR